MKESNLPLRNKWIKKHVRDFREIQNLKYLIKLNPAIVPRLKNIEKDYYIIENCELIEPTDFSPSNFNQLHRGLIIHLHKFKNQHFTRGIYKYFLPYPVGVTIDNQKYIPYILNELENVINILSVQFPGLKNRTFNYLFKNLKNTSDYYKNWKPLEGYSLLHGDLHIGNIAKKDGKYLLIDYEYMRFGASELEVANLITSALIWHYKRDFEKDFSKTITSYLQVCADLSHIDYALFKYFLIFSMNLFYLSSYIKKDKISLMAILRILENIK